jgi:TonB family protein
MNRLQKKCVIATAGFHLLLLVILFIGPAFFNSKPKVDDSQVLDVIPANLIDAAFNSGVKGAQPPPPAPMVVSQPRPPTPPAPQPTLLTKLVKIFTPEPATTTPAPTENQPHKIQPNLTPIVRTAPENSASKPQPNSLAAKNAVQNLRHYLSSSTTIDMPGDSSAAYANYGDVVVSVYRHAFQPPNDMASDSVIIKFKVTIASDGTVISAHIVTSSGDASVDAAVQRMLDRVTFIAPFPEGTKDKDRTYPINFNATRTIE